jgi:hypothetical protein
VAVGATAVVGAYRGGEDALHNVRNPFWRSRRVGSPRQSFDVEVALLRESPQRFEEGGAQRGDACPRASLAVLLNEDRSFGHPWMTAGTRYPDSNFGSTRKSEAGTTVSPRRPPKGTGHPLGLIRYFDPVACWA